MGPDSAQYGHLGVGVEAQQNRLVRGCSLRRRTSHEENYGFRMVFRCPGFAYQFKGAVEVG